MSCVSPACRIWNCTKYCQNNIVLYIMISYKTVILPFKTESQRHPSRGGHRIISHHPPFGIKHPSLAEVLSLQFTEIILQDLGVLKFKSLYTISRIAVARKKQNSCIADICGPHVWKESLWINLVQKGQTLFDHCVDSTALHCSQLLIQLRYSPMTFLPSVPSVSLSFSSSS